ncbi:hypothetical protein ACIF9R_15880 [Streptomyces sp. NPDC086080]|uniref:hypothetical protein n=1 Tax=Streptomyces sp. NPDC086080 TaxID=3365748 RepID=UPI0037D0ECEA
MRVRRTVCVLPLALRDAALAGWLSTLSVLPRTLVLTAVAVPVVFRGLVPHLRKIRISVLTSRSSS